MSQHTPEPWEVEEYKGDYPWLIVGKNGEDITSTLKESDAKRICLCVNALANIPDEDLEALSPEDMQRAINWMNQAHTMIAYVGCGTGIRASRSFVMGDKYYCDDCVRKRIEQNAELVEALEGLLYFCDEFGINNTPTRKAREVLAKTKGE